ncbi:AraC family transcriptional regulator ligand-binding domain-containing protein [Nocardia stercoris]|uniref:AraC family transcriptional regulator n=1 Tax=Nocardia stercoris TaxID=2483361 RepID=A0A3M2L1Q8_9NOCA|nr:AraC family transcriptional regulator ligand-binding domain-containing protein [Nocardia stercoris]RMI31669.1 AraC family transcriptional regulator [Nocardia stercoris]
MYSTLLANMVIAAGGETGGRRIATAAGIPGTLPSKQMITSEQYHRLWELAEYEYDVPDLAWHVANSHRPGLLGMQDYLFRTGSTIRSGLAACVRHSRVLTTNHAALQETYAGTEPGQTTGYRLVDGGGHGTDLAAEFWIGLAVKRLREATGEPIVPMHVTLRKRPPRRHRYLFDILGDCRIDFDAPAITFTIKAEDLDRPLVTADPMLAAILDKAAAAVPPAPERAVATNWPDRVQEILSHTLGTGDSSLEAVARRLAVGPRTLQRRLAASGTSWRCELDRARRLRWAENADRSGDVRARQLGYSDARALRRATRRWTGAGT